VQKHNGEPIIKHITWGHNACKLFEEAKKAESDMYAGKAVSDMYYLDSMIEKIAIERVKAVDGMILGEIKQIAVENGIETKIVLNEKKIAEALQKQIPQKPNFEGDGYDDSGELIYDTWICPNCGDRYELDYEIHQYCPVCGQRLDWDAAKGE
jgi:rubrerythrin